VLKAAKARARNSEKERERERASERERIIVRTSKALYCVLVM